MTGWLCMRGRTLHAVALYASALNCVRRVLFTECVWDFPRMHIARPAVRSLWKYALW